MSGQVEYGMFNIEVFLYFKIGYSAFIIQSSLSKLSAPSSMLYALDPLIP